MSSPDPRRYWPLWSEYSEGHGKSESDIKPFSAAAAATAAATAAAGPDAQITDTAATATVDPRRQLREELELARYNMRMRKQMEDRDRTIDECRRKIKVCQREKAELRRELDRVTMIPHVNQCIAGDEADEEVDYRGEEREKKIDFWTECVPPELRCDKRLAWLLLRTFETQPVPFQKTLWMDPSCPLRTDRDILLASVDRGLDKYRVRIVWTQETSADRELVLKCLAECPQCVCADDDRDVDQSGFPTWCLDDMEALRAFAFSTSQNARDYRIYDHRRRGFHSKFNSALFKDSALMADLIIQLHRTRYEEGWAELIVREAFPRGVRHDEQPLLDNADFALRVANGLVDTCEAHRHWCPVEYHGLSLRLQETPEVAMAFFRLCGSNIRNVPQTLSSNDQVWSELWRVATTNCPGAIYFASFQVKPCLDLLSSKELVLRILERSKECNPRDRLVRFGKFFPSFSPVIKNDRDIIAQMVLLGADADSTELQAWLAPDWIHSSGFWIDLATNLRCPCSGWRVAPRNVSSDTNVVLAWARNARPDGAINWIVSAVANYDHLDLLSDRQVLLNWMPELCSHGPEAALLLGRKYPEIIQVKSLWLELLTKGGERDVTSCIPDSLRQDPDIVDAQLQYCANDECMFLRAYARLPVELQLQFAQHLIVAIKRSEKSSFKKRWSHDLKPELLHVSEVARAAISKGWGPEFNGFEDVVKASPWSKDTEFLLSLALDKSRKYDFWKYCSVDTRRYKAFVLKLHQLEHVPWLDLEEDLNYDFDIMCARYARHPEYYWYAPSPRELEFARTVRELLGLYLTLEELAGRFHWQPGPGNGAPPLPARIATLSGRDESPWDSSFKRRVMEYLGAPSEADVAVLRKASNAFTKRGY
jgi:hypothetical protein